MIHDSSQSPKMKPNHVTLQGYSNIAKVFSCANHGVSIARCEIRHKELNFWTGLSQSIKSITNANWCTRLVFTGYFKASAYLMHIPCLDFNWYITWQKIFPWTYLKSKLLYPSSSSIFLVGVLFGLLLLAEKPCQMQRKLILENFCKTSVDRVSVIYSHV